MGIFSTTVGKKYAIAITGLVWTLFVMQHMLGNLLIFVSPQAYNSYSYAITSNPFLLYGGEAVLLLSLLIHLGLALSLNLDNKKARGSAYSVLPNGAKSASFASRTMVFTGCIVLVFIVYHIWTFKYGAYYEAQYDEVTMRDLHRLILEVFQNPAYVLGYVFCLIVLGIHLSHGVSSMFKSWGFNHPKYTPWLEKFGYVYAVVVAAGFIAQPLYAMMQR